MATPRLGPPGSAAFLERSAGAPAGRASDPLRARSGGHRPVMAASKTTLQSTSTSWVRKTASEVHSQQSRVRAACHHRCAERHQELAILTLQPTSAKLGCASPRAAVCARAASCAGGRSLSAQAGVLSSSYARSGRLQTTAVLIRGSDSVARRAGWARIQRARERHVRPVRIWR
eukprot:CAMPEP_0118819670 /NCGR_PEP_ID=MMETSP1162-20130426/7116_1 /TAXON_ID=33656 /ORGANISM="Phaeocystis Sp, Strain CCMP2710" /LENGTH=173 /DNA_ID=CAMNT_0006749979 /DNA_START=92 /DNA_END=613 /DNA_ORIENTATION=-